MITGQLKCEQIAMMIHVLRPAMHMHAQTSNDDALASYAYAQMSYI